MLRQGESCAGIRRPPKTAAVHLDPTVGNPSRKAEAAHLCYCPQAYGVTAVANISFLMLGICYQSCTLQLKSQMTWTRGSKCSLVHTAGAFGEMLIWPRELWPTTSHLACKPEDAERLHSAKVAFLPVLSVSLRSEYKYSAVKVIFRKTANLIFLPHWQVRSKHL